MKKYTTNKVAIDLLKILKENEITNFSSKTNLLNLGIIDSHDFVRIISQIEENFKIKFLPKEISNSSIGKIGYLKKIIKKKLNVYK